MGGGGNARLDVAFAGARTVVGWCAEAEYVVYERLLAELESAGFECRLEYDCDRGLKTAKRVLVGWGHRVGD